MTKDYKDSLNLPHTEFPMRGNLAKREPDMLERWQTLNVYQRMLDKTRDSQKTFVLHDGPPYANGDIHSGHAVNKILKDIIVKSKTLSGYHAPFVPGWDCHGLPIEVQVEKKLGKSGRDISAAEFRTECRRYAQSQVEKQREDFIRLGVFADWNHPYLTMDYTYEADIVRALGKIITNGHLERGFKPVYWSVASGSALAEAEVEYKDKTSTTVDVRFTVADIGQLPFDWQTIEKKPVSIVIWTTTPWTLPANQAVSLHADLDYALVANSLSNQTEYLIIANDLVEQAMQRYKQDEYQIIASCKGVDLAGLQLKHPFYERHVPVILGDHVTTETGTGAVHTAPDHGMDDFIVGNRNGLTTLNLVTDRGLYRDDVPLLAGMHVHKVDDKIIELLQQHGTLVHTSKITHSFPHCWRTKCPLIFRATPQWFISMQKNNLLAQVNQQVDQVTWLPGWGRARIESMLASSPDWCISRQRTWGAPIPLFVHKQTQDLHPQSEQLIEQVAKLIERKGVQAWFDLDASTVLPNEDVETYSKVTDTLDVWFDSGVTHEAVLRRRTGLRYPADLYLEGSDQHRGWFQSSLKTAVAINNNAPYKTVLTHGFTVDAKGKKMSKSLGNTVSPQKICNSLGADILRLWVAATDFSGEMHVSDEILKRVADSYRRIRNTLRFLLANMNGFDPQVHQVNPNDMIKLDRWLVSKTLALQEKIIGHYERYEFHQIYQLLHNFCIVDLGGFYLDIIKDRQYTTPENSHARRSTQTAMYHVSEALTRWLAPILSFTAEEVWSELPGKHDDTVFTASWYDQLQRLNNNESFNHDFWDQIIDVRTAVQKKLEALRADDKIGSSLDAEVDLYCSDRLFDQLKQLDGELRFALITSSANIHRLTEDMKADPDHVTTPRGAALTIKARKSLYQKCVRCWHLREDVGATAEHPELCGRCVMNLSMPGEHRRYV